MLSTALFTFALAFAFAAVEVESEGKHGWAEKQPTWYRTHGWPARLFGMLSGKKPLTGYHLWLLVLTLLVFHLPFSTGIQWTPGAELRTFATYALWTSQWDYLWFVLNPAYTWRGFRRDNVWWFKQPWLFGRVPFDYLSSVVVSFVLAWGAQWLGDARALLDQVLLLGVYLLGTLLTALLSPLYHHWYNAVRRRDDRPHAGISHRDTNR